MKEHFRKFLVGAIAITLFLGVASYFILTKAFALSFGGVQVSVLVFHFLLAIGVQYLLIRSTKGRPQSFVNTYMAATAGKMMVALICLVPFYFLDKPNFLATAIIYLCNYLFFLVFEVATLLKLFQQANEKSEKEEAIEQNMK